MNNTGKEKGLSPQLREILGEAEEESRIQAMIDAMLEVNPDLPQEEARRQAMELLERENSEDSLAGKEGENKNNA